MIFSKRKGQLSLEFILLILGVMVAGTFVAMNIMDQNPKFLGDETPEIKKESMGLFVSEAKFDSGPSTIETEDSGNTGTTNETESGNNNTETTTTETTDNETESSDNEGTSTGVIGNISVHVSGNGHLSLLNDGLTNYTPLPTQITIERGNNDTVIIVNGRTIAGHNILEYSANGVVDYLAINHISGWAVVTIHNVEKINNLNLWVTGTGNSDTNAYIDGVNITTAIIESRGGGLSSNIEIRNSYIKSAYLIAKGGGYKDWDTTLNGEAKISVINTTIESALWSVKGNPYSVKIVFINSTINGEHYENMAITPR